MWELSNTHTHFEQDVAVIGDSVNRLLQHLKCPPIASSPPPTAYDDTSHKTLLKHWRPTCSESTMPCRLNDSGKGVTWSDTVAPVVVQEIQISAAESRAINIQGPEIRPGGAQESSDSPSNCFLRVEGPPNLEKDFNYKQNFGTCAMSDGLETVAADVPAYTRIPHNAVPLCSAISVEDCNVTLSYIAIDSRAEQPANTPTTCNLAGSQESFEGANANKSTESSDRELSSVGCASCVASGISLGKISGGKCCASLLGAPVGFASYASQAKQPEAEHPQGPTSSRFVSSIDRNFLGVKDGSCNGSGNRSPDTFGDFCQSSLESASSMVKTSDLADTENLIQTTSFTDAETDTQIQ